MSVVKVIEVLSQSNQSWEDAIKKALQEVSQTVRHIKSIYVKDFQAIVENDSIIAYRTNLKISFVVEKYDRE